MPAAKDPSHPPAKPAGAFRVVHTADWHLGKTLGDLSREEEHARFLDFLFETLVASDADLLIVAGDIFDSANPPQSAQSQYYSFLTRLFRESSCQTLIVAGNHDSPAQLDAPVQALRELRVTVVGTAGDPLVLFPDPEHPRLAVAAIPFLRDRDLRSGKPGQSAEAIRKAVCEGIGEHYGSAAKLIQDKVGTDVPAIATGHLTVAGSKASDSERDIHIGGLGAISAGVFPEIFQYVALGHLHRPQRCGGDERVRYSGSPIPLSFSEAGDEKGLRVLDFAEQRLAAQHAIPIPLSRPLVQLRCKRSDLELAVKGLQLPAGEFTPWVELVVEDPLAGEDLMAVAREAAEGKAFEIVRVITGAAAVSQGLRMGDDGEMTHDDADDLLQDPARVFGLRLDGEESLEAGEREALELAFRGLLEELQSGGAAP